MISQITDRWYSFKSIIIYFMLNRFFLIDFPLLIIFRWILGVKRRYINGWNLISICIFFKHLSFPFFLFVLLVKIKYFLFYLHIFQVFLPDFFNLVFNLFIDFWVWKIDLLIIGFFCWTTHFVYSNQQINIYTQIFEAGCYKNKKQLNKNIESIICSFKKD